MSTSTLAACPARRTTALAKFRDFVELTKPRVSVLVLVTVGVGFYLASWGRPELWLLTQTLLGTALVAGSASAINQYLERKTDARMPRTASRPLPAGRLSGTEVVVFGAITLVLGTSLLLPINATTAALGLLTWLLYTCVYTPMKTQTSLNTVVGAVPGAMPAVMGWTAAGRALDIEAATLFGIVFLWQFPHFLAIAYLYRKQYAAAGLRMLPSVDRTGRLAPAAAVLYALALLPVSLIPAVECLAGRSYFAGALALGIGYLVASMLFFARTGEGTARGLLRTSLVYLPALLILLMWDLLPI